MIFLMSEMLGEVERMITNQMMSGPCKVGKKFVYIPCDWFPPECAEYEGCF
jgi:hypothetical protein